VKLENFKVNEWPGVFRDAERLIRCHVGGQFQTSHLSDDDPTHPEVLGRVVCGGQYL
jgi:hypothetical protein